MERQLVYTKSNLEGKPQHSIDKLVSKGLAL